MTIFMIDANGKRSEKLDFNSETELIAYLRENSVFLSNWSILRDDHTYIYRLVSDGSFREFMTWDNSARKVYNIYEDAACWGDDLTWIA